MHPAAHLFFAHWATRLGPRRRVLEVGGLDVNGSIRPLFSRRSAEYISIDLRAGKGVDLVADGAACDFAGDFDTVLCAEVLEHAPQAEGICRNAHRLLAIGGVFLVTAAGPGRMPHGCDGGAVGDEFYRNVDHHLLAGWLDPFKVHHIARVGNDTQAVAVKSL